MSNPIRLIDRLHDLRARRSELDNRIKDEMAVPSPNKQRLHTLERLKLKAKDQTKMLRHQFTAGDDPTFPTAA